MRRALRFLALFLGVLGCSRAPAPEQSLSPRTGAEEVAASYFTALVNKDWKSAYDTLDAATRTRLSRAQFAERAHAYCKNLGFEPTSVQVRSCDERGQEAITHVSFKGGTDATPRFYKDSVALEREAGGWAVKLPAYFGKAAAKESHPPPFPNVPRPAGSTGPDRSLTVAARQGVHSFYDVTRSDSERYPRRSTA